MHQSLECATVVVAFFLVILMHRHCFCSLYLAFLEKAAQTLLLTNMNRTLNRIISLLLLVCVTVHFFILSHHERVCVCVGARA